MNAVGFCQRGCSTNPEFSGTCLDCGRPFVTGRFSQDQCRSCEQTENAQYTREASGDNVSHTGYGADMRKNRINRNALATLDPAEVEREKARTREAIREGNASVTVEELARLDAPSNAGVL
jgi:hypothetical protein